MPFSSMILERRLPYDSAEMRNALEEYQQLDSQWKKLEQEHLGLREQILQKEKS